MRFFQFFPWNITDESIQLAFNFLGTEIQGLEPMQPTEVHVFFGTHPHFFAPIRSNSQYYRGRTLILEVNQQDTIVNLWPHVADFNEPHRMRTITISNHAIARFLHRFHGIEERRSEVLSKMHDDLIVRHAHCALIHTYRHGSIPIQRNRELLSRYRQSNSREYGINYYYKNGIVIIVDDRNCSIITTINPLVNYSS